MNNPTNTLFQPLMIGRVTAKNRLALSSMSRHRSTLAGVPTALNVEFYRQRARAGLVLGEGTYPSQMGRAYLFKPGLHDEAQLMGWRRVADAVHSEGGIIFVQIMHAGRMSDPLLLDGEQPVAPSAVQPQVREGYDSPWPRPKRAYGMPRPLTHAEILKVIDEHRDCAVLAKRAGLDGVEIHSAAGYLPMQFLSTNTNLRTDEWGGSVERRSAFLLALVDAMAAATSREFVSVKLSPGWTFNQVEDTDPIATYSWLVSQLSKRGIAYLQLANYGVGWDVYGKLRRLFEGPVIVGVGFNRRSAAQIIADRGADMVAFGQAYIANPDLAERYRHGWRISRPKPATYYTQGEDGYIDYPVYSESDPKNLQSADEALVPLMA
jgi:N-ethylmaleimide reductase